jgi:hypothetical protein
MRKAAPAAESRMSQQCAAKGESGMPAKAASGVRRTIMALASPSVAAAIGTRHGIIAARKQIKHGRHDPRAARVAAPALPVTRRGLCNQCRRQMGGVHSCAFSGEQPG